MLENVNLESGQIYIQRKIELICEDFTLLQNQTNAVLIEGVKGHEHQFMSS